MLFSLLASSSTEDMEGNLRLAHRLIVSEYGSLTTIYSFELRGAEAKEEQLRRVLKTIDDKTWHVLLSLLEFPTQDSLGIDLRKMLDLIVDLLTKIRRRSEENDRVNEEEARLRLALKRIMDDSWESLLYFFSLPCPYYLTTDLRPTLDCISELLISYRNGAKNISVIQEVSKVLAQEMSTADEHNRAMLRTPGLHRPIEVIPPWQKHPTVQYCCECHNGPCSTALHAACIVCNHRFCANCEVE
ncbi:hypothetical protein K432DRAFT_164855 [Lepidopterella palustris CBS 459.81]|uniref:Uncharacterized protein n=1 Tax=Lepidopterella palustris CBS 459.81 TaxID=1314670 RepID=A0A8E2EGX9_9PEZI|nr:hypothetical protein K432DRAFT_164855 [Lepidopterella palustris CBS 459.81]